MALVQMLVEGKKPAVEQLVKETTGRCTVCRKPKPAEVLKIVRDGREQVILRVVCPCHGKRETVLATDARFYHRSIGDRTGNGCGCGPSCAPVGEAGTPGFLGSNALETDRVGKPEVLSTCVALIEITDACNLSCPTCFADSPLETEEQSFGQYTFENLIGRMQDVVERKGGLDIIQFSGGEPTMHPDFYRLVTWVRSNPKIKYLLINTNGVRFAKDQAFVDKMGELFKRFDNIQLYLQFDGPQEEGQTELRGADLRRVREQAIRNCQRVGIPITLAMTVDTPNLQYLWDTVMFAQQFDNIRGVSFQPIFSSGRNPKNQLVQIGQEKYQQSSQPIGVADIILGLHEQSKELIKIDDFTPLPCGDPNCATIGWLFRKDGQYFSPSAFGIDIPKLQATMPDRVNYRIEDLEKCGCDGTELGELMKTFEATEANAFRIFIKPFMGLETFDKDRTDRCCTHVIDKEGNLVSFCDYYSPKPDAAACCPT